MSDEDRDDHDGTQRNEQDGVSEPSEQAEARGRAGLPSRKSMKPSLDLASRFAELERMKLSPGFGGTLAEQMRLMKPSLDLASRFAELERMNLSLGFAGTLAEEMQRTMRPLGKLDFQIESLDGIAKLAGEMQRAVHPLGGVTKIADDVVRTMRYLGGPDSRIQSFHALADTTKDLERKMRPFGKSGIRIDSFDALTDDLRESIRRVTGEGSAISRLIAQVIRQRDMIDALHPTDFERNDPETLEGVFSDVDLESNERIKHIDEGIMQLNQAAIEIKHIIDEGFKSNAEAMSKNDSIPLYILWISIALLFIALLGWLGIDPPFLLKMIEENNPPKS